MTAVPASPAAARSRRLPALDLLRFLAAAMVLVFHFGFRGAAADGFLDVGFPELSPWARYGYLGVDLFFMISGFVILLTVDAGGGRLSHFTASRLSRLYPVFWVAATITFLFVHDRPAPFGVGARDFLLNLGMVPEVFGAQPVDGVYWTLETELRFYLLVALYLLFLRPRLAIEWILAGWLLALAAMQSTLPVPYLVRAALLADSGTFFVFGCVFYRIWNDGWSAARIVLLIVAGSISFVQIVRGAVALSGEYHQSVSSVLACAVHATFLAAFVAMCLRPAWFARGGRLAIVLGALTYPLYLVHQNIGYLLINALSGPLGRWGALAVAIAAVLALAWSLHRFVERTCNGPLRRWLEPRLHFLDRTMPR